MINCQKCMKKNPENAVFCQECGAELVKKEQKIATDKVINKPSTGNLIIKIIVGIVLVILSFSGINGILGMLMGIGGFALIISGLINNNFFSSKK